MNQVYLKFVHNKTSIATTQQRWRRRRRRRQRQRQQQHEVTEATIEDNIESVHHTYHINGT